jgi:hypothetical protein
MRHDCKLPVWKLVYVQKSLKLFFIENMNIKEMTKVISERSRNSEEKKPLQAYQRGFWSTVIGDEA